MMVYFSDGNLIYEFLYWDDSTIENKFYNVY